MSSGEAQRWLCPSREGGDESLIARWVTRVECQERQRRHYHKCPTCQHRNGAPTAERRERVTSPEPAPGTAT